MFRELLVGLCLLAGSALAQGYPPVGSDTSSGSGGVTTSAPTFTSTQTDGGASFVAPTGGRVCHNGAPCTVNTTYDGGTVGVVGAPLSVTGGYENLGPDIIAALLGRDLSFDTLVLTRNEATGDTLTLLGGRLRFAAVEVNANAWMSFSSSTGFELGNQLNIADGAFVTVDNLAPKRTSETLSLYGTHGLRLVAQASVDACVSGLKGQVTTLTTDGLAHWCNGTDNQPLLRAIIGTATVDFPNILALAESTQTMTVTGAAAGNPTTCNATTALEPLVFVKQAWVSAADTVSITETNLNALAAIDPASKAFACTVAKP